LGVAGMPAKDCGTRRHVPGIQYSISPRRVKDNIRLGISEFEGVRDENGVQRMCLGVFRDRSSAKNDANATSTGAHARTTDERDIRHYYR